MNKRYVGLIAALSLLAMPLCGTAADDILRAETVIENNTSSSEAVQHPNRDEFADQEKHTLTRIVREVEYKGIPVVVLDMTDKDDGFGHISVDKATELGREILRLCPGGSTCKINAIITNGTLTRIYSIQKVN